MEWRYGTGNIVSLEDTFVKVERGCTCACWPSKIGLSLYQISHNHPPISIPFLKEKHPILLKLGAFHSSLLKLHPIYVIWALLYLMTTN